MDRHRNFWRRPLGSPIHRGTSRTEIDDMKRRRNKPWTSLWLRAPNSCRTSTEHPAVAETRKIHCATRTEHTKYATTDGLEDKSWLVRAATGGKQQAKRPATLCTKDRLPLLRLRHHYDLRPAHRCPRRVAQDEGCLNTTTAVKRRGRQLRNSRWRLRQISRRNGWQPCIEGRHRRRGIRVRRILRPLDTHPLDRPGIAVCGRRAEPRDLDAGGVRLNLG